MVFANLARRIADTLARLHRALALRRSSDVQELVDLPNFLDPNWHGPPEPPFDPPLKFSELPVHLRLRDGGSQFLIPPGSRLRKRD